MTTDPGVSGAGGFQWRFVKDNLNIKIEPIKRVRTGEKKRVYQYNFNHELIAVFNGVREAAQQLNINPSNLSAAASGKRKAPVVFYGRMKRLVLTSLFLLVPKI